MAYFSNGSEGCDYYDKHCTKCIHEKIGECAVWTAHLAFNGRERSNADSILHYLIPRDEAGNGKCKLFVEATATKSTKARNAAIRTYEHWLTLVSKEEAFDHALAEYLIITGNLTPAPAPTTSSKVTAAGFQSPAPHVAALVDEIMEQAQVFASTYALVGGRFDDGTRYQQSEDEKAALRRMIEAVIQPPAPRAEGGE